MISCKDFKRSEKLKNGIEFATMNQNISKRKIPPFLQSKNVDKKPP